MPLADLQSETNREILRELKRAVATGSSRHLLEIFEDIAPRLTSEPARATRELVMLVRNVADNQPMRRALLASNRAFQSLIWLIRIQAKVEHHFHFSGNIDPVSGPLNLGNDPSDTGSPRQFTEQKRRIDAAVTSAQDFLACMEHVVANAFSDGCTHVELRFNPFRKPYCSDLYLLLEKLHGVLSKLEESFAAAVNRPHAVRFVFSLNRSYGPALAEEAVARLENAPRSARAGWQQRVYGLDLSGLESAAFPPRAWHPAFFRAATLGLATIVHLGDATLTDLPSIAAHLDYVEESLDCLAPIERIGHASTLAPWVERQGGMLTDARGQLPRVLSLLRRIADQKIAIETAPSPVLSGPSGRLHRTFFWRQLDFPLSVIPVADEIFQYHTTLSMWIADLLLLSPEGAGSWTWQAIFDRLRPGKPFFRAG